jgi:hypothetical protein
MNYDSKAAQSAKSREVLREVTELGVSQGLFTVARKAGDEADPWRWVDVVTPDGLAFSLTGGAWGKEGAITARVGSIDRDAIRVHLSDTTKRGSEVSASCAFARGAAVVLKDLMRRVIANPEGIACAKEVRDTWQARHDEREALRGHIKALEALGFTFDVDARETYSARGHKHGSGIDRLTVNSHGYASFEASCPVERFASALEALGTPNSSR